MRQTACDHANITVRLRYRGVLDEMLTLAYAHAPDGSVSIEATMFTIFINIVQVINILTSGQTTKYS